jgi:DNA-binding NtrC family response regulator
VYRLSAYRLVPPIVVLFLLLGAATDPDVVHYAPLSTLGVGGVALAVLAQLVSLLPLSLGSARDATIGARRVGGLAFAAAVLLLDLAFEGPSLPLAMAARLAHPVLGALVVLLAFDAPDAPRGLRPYRSARTLVGLLAAAVAVLAGVELLAPFPWDEELLIPPAWRLLAPGFALAATAAAFALRALRRRLGSTPEALAVGAWAQGGTGLATASGLAAAAAEATGLDGLARSAAAFALLALVVGHVAMARTRHPVTAGLAVRRAISVLLATAGGAVVATLLALDVGSRLGVALSTAFAIALGLAARPLLEAVLHRTLVPFGGRLLDGVAEAEAALAEARTLDELASGVLGALRRASGDLEAAPALHLLDPEREIGLDAAGLPHARKVGMSLPIYAALREAPGTLLLRGPLEERLVRMPLTQPLVDALRERDALAVVPFGPEEDLEGALVVPRGRRRSDLTLEERAALHRLATKVGGALAFWGAEERARLRVRDANRARDDALERLEVLEEEHEALLAIRRRLVGGGHPDRYAPHAIAYSPAMRQLTERLAEVAGLDAPVLLVGEEGVDLEQLAYVLHRDAGGDRPFVVADALAVRPEAAELALFGDGDGHRGWLELAHGGTLVVAHAPALPRPVQERLSEVLATKGDGPAKALGTRLVLTSRVLPAEAAADGRFAAPLERRLAPLTLVVPPLRERAADLPSLVYLALDRSCRLRGREVMGIERAALDRLAEHAWPGNQRELEAVVDRAVAEARGELVREADLPPLSHDGAVADPWDAPFAEIERVVVLRALERAGGNRAEAARRLGLARSTFAGKLKRLGLTKPKAEA